VLGTGLMGAPMARNLLAAGHETSVWNRSPDKAAALTAEGALHAASVEAAISGAEVIISMLSDGAATAEILANPAVQSALPPGAIWIEMASVKPEEARTQAELLATKGLRHLDAPVSGGTRGAENGMLAIMVGGDLDVFHEALSVLIAMGRPTHVGPSGAGQLAKLANQTIVAITIGAVAEAMLLLEKGGANPQAVRDALKGGFADSTILQQHGKRMSNRDFAPGGLSRLQLKDLDNALAEARSFGLTLPMAEDTRARFAHLVHDLDGAGLDHSALFLDLLERNGETS